ncbi:2-methylaconitate cis-trans isomerase PrpF family protein [Paenibacillus hamazuiensis]|uniref:2-methylaconitate cis-trans isomerase PrpF family protein n=1 Tax=Paenibacillus hamazuiensis TaxID=2936508 RepID=UPI00200FB3CD|nr:PrpF domain-containing protein [Paenibacillus hamazuiensis]
MYDYGQIHKIPAVIMRGGTSKGLILRKADLPADPFLRDEVILRLYGSPDSSQIDGLGGGTSLTSKLAIVGPPSLPEANIDYTFGQVSIEKKMIDYNVTCGNFVSAVGLYAAEEGYVRLQEPFTPVNIYNTNTGKMIIVEIPVKDGQIEYDGDFVIDGVPGTSAQIMINFPDSGGAFTGRLLPTGRPVDVIRLKDGRQFEVSVVDCANVVVFVRACDLGLKGTELQDEVNGNRELLNTLEEIRVEAGIRIGLIRQEERDAVSPISHALPKIAMTAPSSRYVSSGGKVVNGGEADIASRYISMGALHRAYAVSGGLALAAAAQIPGTIPNQLVSPGNRCLRIGHPSGVLYVEASIERSGESWTVTRAASGRTARRLMEGYAHIPVSVLQKNSVGTFAIHANMDKKLASG